MRQLYHYPLSPFSRRVRIMMGEKELPHEVVIEPFWERRREFLAMNPAAQVPVLIEEDGAAFSDSGAVCEYLEERYKRPVLIGSSVDERAEVRRITGWFNNKFYYEVTKYIVDEKVYKFYRNLGSPNTKTINIAKDNMIYHLDYIAHLIRNRSWLAGESFSLADITAVAHLSVLDYLGDVPWEYNSKVKEWYMLIKSRPSFRAILEESVPSFKPPIYYKMLDF